MNDVIEGKWKQFAGKAKEQWGELTDDDVKKAEGGFEQLVGVLQERYGWEREKAEKEAREWADALQ